MLHIRHIHVDKEQWKVNTHTQPMLTARYLAIAVGGDDAFVAWARGAGQST